MRTAIISFVHQFSKIKMISKEIGPAYSGKLDFSSKNMGTILFQQKNVAPSKISLIFPKFLKSVLKISQLEAFPRPRILQKKSFLKSPLET